MKDKKERQKERLVQLHGDLIRSIFRKIPVLEGEKEIYLHRMYFEKLTDEEFIVLWSMPNLVIRVNPKAADYIEERRRLLGLKMSGMSGVLRGKEEST